MNPSVVRSRSANKGRSGEFVARPPQVNLLPPEIHAARGLRSTRRVLALVLAGVLGVCGLGYVAALVEGSNADTRLEDAQADTTRLTMEQAQYAEVPQIKSVLADTHQAIALGMSTEVQWKPYLDAVTAVLPAGVSVESFATTGATPMTGIPASGHPLEPVSTGQITMTVRSLTVPDTAGLIEALDSVPGLGGAWTSAVTVTADEAGTPYYDVAASVQVLETAYSHRFDLAEGEQ